MAIFSTSLCLRNQSANELIRRTLEEAAVILAGAFAIIGAVFDVRDKRSGHITAWGKIFFTLTVISMICGVYVQWVDNTDEATRNEKAQSEMIALLQQTKQSIYELSRVLQPLDKPTVTLIIKPDCNLPALQSFCRSAIALAKLQAIRMSGISDFVVDGIDWSLWPVSFYAAVFIYLYKNNTDAERYLRDGTPGNAGAGDMNLNLLVTNTKPPQVTVNFDMLLMRHGRLADSR